MISNRLQKLSESATLEMARKSRELKEKGIDIISLSLGEPDFNTPEKIKKAAKKAIEENYSHYTPVPGMLNLRKAISEKLERDNKIKYKPSQIVTSTGAKQSIANVCLSLINPGDEIILLAPYWVSYIEIIKFCEGVPVIIESDLENDFKIKAEEIEKKITKKTKLILFNSPCNPSGSVYSQKEIEDIAQILKKNKKLFIISDEIYEHICFDVKHFSIGSIDEIKEQVITINGVSKGFAMTGWRLGYIGAPQWIADACNKIQGQFTSATSSITQKAVECAMEIDPSELNSMKIEFKQRRNLIIKELEEIPGVITNTPEGAFYVFCDISNFFNKKYKKYKIKNSHDLSIFLLESAHVAVVAGNAFGNNKCIRISYATSKSKIKEAIQRIAIALKKLSD